LLGLQCQSGIPVFIPIIIIIITTTTAGCGLQIIDGFKMVMRRQKLLGASAAVVTAGQYCTTAVSVLFVSCEFGRGLCACVCS
jgi:hypothetical protein